MKTWICNTMCNFYGPLLGAARLYAYVKNQGYDIEFKDLNQDSYFTLLSGEYLEPAIEKMRHSIDSYFRTEFCRGPLGSIVLGSSNKAMKQLIAKGMLLNTSWYKYVKDIDIARKPLYGIIDSKISNDNILYALLSEKDYVLSEIEKSRKILDESFFSLPVDEFLHHFNTLLCGKAIIDMTYFPAQMDFGLGFHGTAFGLRAGDILRAVDDERHNFLIPYYRNKVLPMFTEEQPGLVGISITCLYEIIPAMTLAHMIKKTEPQTHIALGGVVATQIADRITGNRSLWDMFDSLVLGPGEHAFTGLIDHVGNQTDLSGVPNIIYKDKNSIKRSTGVHEFDINDACTPEFVNVRPQSGLPLETTSGCYWGKCIFCYYPEAGSSTHNISYQKKRVRNMDSVLDDIRLLKEKYDPVAIVLTDSSTHPDRMEAIAEDNLRSEKKVKFSALFRFEKKFKSREFCRKLVNGGFLGGYVGLESGSQRVNNIINKGIDLEDVKAILKNFRETGILIHLFSIIGIPGETGEDARMTYEFIKRWHRWLKLDWEIYYLYVFENCPIAKRADEFGLTVKPLPEDYLTNITLYKTTNGLSQNESSSLAIGYGEKLKRYMHPLNRIMDIESMSLFLLAQKAKGITPEKIKNPGIQR
jgi:radical SAM superfamily enzyme YgiQ (UPF0313 family)